MKKIILFLSVMLGFSPIALAGSYCFIAKEGNKILKQEGECSKRYSPGSSFKIPLALMGYDSRVLEDETHPVWPFKKDYNLLVNVWKGDHNPQSWMIDSCVWYSQVLTKKLGMDKFKEYVHKFHYGNQDISGDEGKNNGLNYSWLSSSLEISPEEQITFLQQLTARKLPVSYKAYEMTKKIIFIQELPGGWKLYGKTGNGTMADNYWQGWFVGWIEKNGRIITFASHIKDHDKQEVPASFRARNEALNKLWFIINELAT